MYLHLKRSGFTLIELLVVIAIIGILAALIIVSLAGARSKANDTSLKNNLSTITSALAQYHVDHSSTFPDSGGAQVALNDVLLINGLASYFSAGAASGVFTFNNVSTGYGSPIGGISFIAASGLNSSTEAPTLSGNGVYQTNGGGNAGEIDANSLTLTGIHNNADGDSINGRAFVTYAQQ